MQLKSRILPLTLAVLASVPVHAGMSPSVTNVCKDIQIGTHLLVEPKIVALQNNLVKNQSIGFVQSKDDQYHFIRMEEGQVDKCGINYVEGRKVFPVMTYQLPTELLYVPIDGSFVLNVTDTEKYLKYTNSVTNKDYRTVNINKEKGVVSVRFNEYSDFNKVYKDLADANYVESIQPVYNF